MKGIVVKCFFMECEWKFAYQKKIEPKDSSVASTATTRVSSIHGSSPESTLAASALVYVTDALYDLIKHI